MVVDRLDVPVVVFGLLRLIERRLNPTFLIWHRQLVIRNREPGRKKHAYIISRFMS